MSSANVEDLPVVIDYILTQKLSPKNAVDVSNNFLHMYYMDIQMCTCILP